MSDRALFGHVLSGLVEASDFVAEAKNDAKASTPRPRLEPVAAVEIPTSDESSLYGAPTVSSLNNRHSNPSDAVSGPIR